ncbi:predicted protein [Uncinocarpus reesii 1704]|uniref:Yeast cell wall synthesis Kre9/Knh1-like N-terminal domain-containing protein n=1 Tax=Uncinocarpus reesii (strain UAMH 1704) TaxID=336963 RepID=C4JGK1_UNCRE|nr:uncharacterized protein UREG_01192 [Uncinocarpus reesii 1704]EEP76343.1 predicted protein [Uncinocarpus reesii 1704]
MNVHPPFLMRIARGIKSNAGSYSTKPMHNAPDGKAYQFNFVSDDPSRPGILAQSQQFTVQSGPHAQSDSSSSNGITTPATTITPPPGPIPSLTSSLTRNPNNTAIIPGYRGNTVSLSSNSTAAPTSTRRSSTTRVASGSNAERTSNAAPVLQAYSGVGGLVLAALAFVA